MMQAGAQRKDDCLALVNHSVSVSRRPIQDAEARYIHTEKKVPIISCVPDFIVWELREE